MKTRSHINNDVVANNWGEKVVVVSKKKDRRIVQSDPKLRHPVMKGRLKGGASDAMFNVVVCHTAKGACGVIEDARSVCRGARKELAGANEGGARFLLLAEAFVDGLGYVAIGVAEACEGWSLYFSSFFSRDSKSAIDFTILIIQYCM